MAAAMTEAPTTPSRKRNHEGEIVSLQSSVEETIVITNGSRQASEAPSTASSLTELTSTGLCSPALKSMSNPDGDHQNPAKKRKLTFAEREVEKAVKKREKEEQERQRVEMKIRKDEEKRRKEEEKEAARRIKELEKAEKKKAEDLKKQEKEDKKKVKEQEREAEKSRKEAEKLKKEKSQMRIASFFGRPAPASTPPTTPDDVSIGGYSRRSSIASIDMPDAITQTDVQRPSNPEFESYIIPYFLHENTDLAPINRWRAVRMTQGLNSRDFTCQTDTEKADLEPIASRFPRPHNRMKQIVPVKLIVQNLQEVAGTETDLTNAVNPLHSVPYKLLSFREDIRPPYVGTYTKIVSPRSARKMSRKPTYRGRPDTNYDYDSEAEWEPPAEDDEEILDDEMSDEEEGEGEMEDFLDDDDDSGRRRMFVGDMEPVSSGLCWQGQDYESNGHDMEQYRMNFLHDSTSLPIDPFSTIHWVDETKPLYQIKKEVSEISMPPPRIPLVTVDVPNTQPNVLSLFKIKQESSTGENVSPEPRQRGRPADPNKALKMIQPEFLPSFKQAIQGSDLTKAGLIEILKKQFPKCSKDAIKDTLGVVAIRVGKKEAEKKWELRV